MNCTKPQSADGIKYRLTAPGSEHPDLSRVDAEPWPRGYLYTTEMADPNAGAVREIIVLDQSEAGARIRGRGRVRLPEIVSVKASCLGGKRRALVNWQTGLDAGLVFI